MYTYSNRNAKSWVLVVRGFPEDIEEEELQEELTTMHLEPTKIYKMKKTKSPLFLVVLGSKITPAQLNKTHQFVAHTKRWGHSSSNCFVKTPRCLKCAEPHPTHSCRKEASTPATCANCRRDHPANYQGCPAHVAYKEAGDRASADSRNRQRPKPNTRRDPARAFLPAPPPVSNPWQRAPTEPTSTPEVARNEEDDFPPLRTTMTPPRTPPSGPGRQSHATSRIPTTRTGCTRPALAQARGNPLPARRPEETPQFNPEERDPPARLELPPAHPQLLGWTHLSTIISKINRELDIEWMDQQQENFYNAVKSATDPFTHISWTSNGWTSNRKTSTTRSSPPQTLSHTSRHSPPIRRQSLMADATRATWRHTKTSFTGIWTDTATRSKSWIPRLRLTEAVIAELFDRTSRHLVIGNLNARHTNWNNANNNANGTVLSNFTERSNIVIQHPDEPTCYPHNGQTPSTIDVVLNKGIALLGECRVVHGSSSDHCPILVTVRTGATLQEDEPHLDFLTTNWAQFRARVCEFLPTPRVPQTTEQLDRVADDVAQAVPRATLDTTSHVSKKSRRRWLPSSPGGWLRPSGVPKTPTGQHRSSPESSLKVGRKFTIWTRAEGQAADQRRLLKRWPGTSRSTTNCRTPRTTPLRRSNEPSATGEIVRTTLLKSPTC
ncbi:Endonuclease-reverse transcriptase [Popillia japonica]|uniref:Endonuclease-reverse transcriptase n=1 Tax=Popillia japonica TaxID=7064 RepID=A0AAW1KFH2_POPJA